jgi:ATP/maltotriose-dependent transcriptional regulator MalT/DNA-binding SARP family transcriptional activator
VAQARYAAPLLDRPRLRAELGQALRRRLTIVLADAGFGKSVLLGAWAATVASAWYTVGADDGGLAVFTLGLARVLERRLPAVSEEIRGVARTSLGPDGDEDDRAAPVAALICESLERELDGDFALVLDDVHELGRTSPSARLLEALCRQAPPQLHLVLGTRNEPPFPVQRLRGRGEVLDLDASVLAFDEAEVAELLARMLGDDAALFASEVYELTLGWPAAVRLVVESLRPIEPAGRAEALSALRRPGGRLFDYLAEEVFARAPAGVRQLLRRIAPFDRFDLDLCRALGIRTAAESLVALRRAGLFVEHRADDASFALHGLVREFLRERWPLDEEERRELHARAAAYFLERGRFDEALESQLAAGDLDAVAATLAVHGQKLLASGKVEATIRIAGRLPPSLRTSEIEQLVGEAHEIRGEWDEALACFERAAGRGRALDAGLAWRLGLIHHLQGRLDEALDAYARAELRGEATRDAALLLAWKASAHWLRGDEEACREAAEDAFSRASAAGDPGALAAAHTVLGMLAALAGDRLANDAHYLRALEYAERAGDVLQAARVRTNRGSQHLEEGEYAQALVELERATQLAELTGFAFFHALALTNRGDVHYRLGRLEEAIADLEAARLLYQRAASLMVAYPLSLLGDVYRTRGDTAMARAFYEDALRNAEESRDVQSLSPALCGLAQLLAAEEPERARDLVDRALGLGDGMGHVEALVAAGWTSLVRGDSEAAAERAGEAAAVARVRRDRAGLAEALEVTALAATDDAQRAMRLEEAVSLWRAVGSPLGEARAELLLGAAAGEARAEEAERTLRAAGARGHRSLPAAVLPAAPAQDGKPVAVVTLGRFAVQRAGRPVGATEWQSKKARDLLKLLVARRGRPTPRDVLMEALWPDEEPRRVSNRLSVALSTLRAVLDPERRHASDAFLVAVGDAIGLRTENVDVDVETFLTASAVALQWNRAGDADARAALESAEATYLGDFLEEELYEDWAAPLREEARAGYLAVAAALADLADIEGDPDSAVRYRLRILERDAYDERAHLGVAGALARAGRHGEARRAYRRYVARMAEIGVEAAPFPGVAESSL